MSRFPATGAALPAAVAVVLSSAGDDAVGRGAVAPGCTAPGPSGPVAKPRFVRRIATGETGWFASPGLVDLDGDGCLEIVLSSFAHGIDVFRVPGSAANCLPWPTGRGGLLRAGTGPATAP